MSIFTMPPGEGLLPNVKILSVEEGIQQATRQLSDRIEKETECWLQKALQRGVGWHVWRSDPDFSDLDPFVVTYRFVLVHESMTDLPGPGVLFRQQGPDTPCPHKAGGCKHTIETFRARSACQFGGCPWGGDF